MWAAAMTRPTIMRPITTTQPIIPSSKATTRPRVGVGVTSTRRSSIWAPIRLRRRDRFRATTDLRVCPSTVDINMPQIFLYITGRRRFMLVPDGVYLTDTEPPYFRRLSAPTREEIQALAQRLSERLGRHLERRGWLVRDAESSHLNFEPRAEDDGLADLQGRSPTASRWVRTGAARRSRCKAYPRQRLRTAPIGWHSAPGSRCTPAWRGGGARAGCCVTAHRRRWRVLVPPRAFNLSFARIRLRRDRGWPARESPDFHVRVNAIESRASKHSSSHHLPH